MSTSPQPPPPASTLNSHHVIKSVVFALLRLDKKDRYNMETKCNWQEWKKRKQNASVCSHPRHVEAMGSGASAACVCRLPRARARLTCVISLLSYTWRTLPLAPSHTPTRTQIERCANPTLTPTIGSEQRSVYILKILLMYVHPLPEGSNFPLKEKSFQEMVLDAWVVAVTISYAP